MTLVEQKTLEKAITLLSALKIQFYVVDRDGKNHGNIEVVTESKKRPRKYQYGERAEHVAESLKGMEIGQMQAIGAEKFPLKELVKTASSWANYHWGAGSIKAASNKKLQRLEVLRLK
jgi:hypothetical protein